MKSEAHVHLLRPLILAFLSGIMLMGTIYYFELDLFFGQWNAAIIAAILIFVLGLWYYFRKQDVVDMEKAGDGCYYLGLAFTLFSLIFVLYSFGEDTIETSAVERTNDVISKFGVALVSTLVGVIFRVVLQSVAKEDELESAELTPDRARLAYGEALSNATRRTLREMRTAEQSFARLSRSTLQNLQTMEGRVGQAGMQAGKNVADAFDRIATKAEVLEKSVVRMQRQALHHDEQIRTQTDTLNRHMSSTHEAVASTAQQLSAASAITNELRETLSSFNAGAESIKVAAALAKERARDLGTEIQAAADNLKNQGKEAAAEFVHAHGEAVEILRNATSDALTAASGLSAAAKEATTAVADTKDDLAVALKDAAMGLVETSRATATEVINSQHEAAEALKSATSHADMAATGLAEAGRKAAAEVASSQQQAADALKGAASDAKKDTAELESKVQDIVRKLKAQGNIASAETTMETSKPSKAWPMRLFRRPSP